MAEAIGIAGAIGVVAVVTGASGLWVAATGWTGVAATRRPLSQHV